MIRETQFNTGSSEVVTSNIGSATIAVDVQQGEGASKRAETESNYNFQTNPNRSFLLRTYAELTTVDLVDDASLTAAISHGNIHILQCKYADKYLQDKSGLNYQHYDSKHLVEFLKTNPKNKIYGCYSSYSYAEAFNAIKSIDLIELAKVTFNYTIGIIDFELLKRLPNLVSISTYTTTAKTVNICNMPNLRKLDLGIIEPGQVTIVNCTTDGAANPYLCSRFDPHLCPELVIEYTTKTGDKCKRLEGYIQEIKALQKSLSLKTDAELTIDNLLNNELLMCGMAHGNIHIVQRKCTHEYFQITSSPVYDRFDSKYLVEFLKADPKVHIYSPRYIVLPFQRIEAFEAIKSADLIELAQHTSYYSIGISDFELLKRLPNLASISFSTTTANTVNLCNMPNLRKLNLGLIKPGCVNIVNCKIYGVEEPWAFDPQLCPELVIEYTTKTGDKCEILEDYIEQIRAVQKSLSLKTYAELITDDLINESLLIDGYASGNIHIAQRKLAEEHFQENQKKPQYYPYYESKYLVEFLNLDPTKKIWDSKRDLLPLPMSKVFETIKSADLIELAQYTGNYSIGVMDFKLLKHLPNLASISFCRTTANTVNIYNMPNLRRLDLGFIEQGCINIVNCTTNNTKKPWAFDPQLCPELVIEYTTKTGDKCEILEGYIEQIRAVQVAD